MELLLKYSKIGYGLLIHHFKVPPQLEDLHIVKFDFANIKRFVWTDSKQVACTSKLGQSILKHWQ